MKEIERLREEIDNIDFRIVEQLKRRIEVVLEIRKVKEQNSLAVEDLAREEEIILKLDRGNLDEKFIRDLYHLVFAYSKSLLKDSGKP